MVEQFRILESQGPRAQAALAMIEDIIARNEILQSPRPRQCQCPCQQTRTEQQTRTTTIATQTPKIVASKMVQFPEIFPNTKDGEIPGTSQSNTIPKPITDGSEESQTNEENHDEAQENLDGTTDENVYDATDKLLDDKTTEDFEDTTNENL